jgi:hypothetical protein
MDELLTARSKKQGSEQPTISQSANLGTGGYETVQLRSAATKVLQAREKKTHKERVPFHSYSGDSLLCCSTKYIYN